MDFMMSGGYNVSAQIEQVHLNLFIFYFLFSIRFEKFLENNHAYRKEVLFCQDEQAFT